MLKNVDTFLLDLDGTVYISGKLIDGAREAIDRMRSRGRVFFVTNNSSVSRADYLKKLDNLGLNAKKEEIFTSATATIEHLKQQKRGEIFLLGTESLAREFAEEGIKISEKSDTVVVAFDTELTYKKLTNCVRLIKNGAYFAATHPDFVCPHSDGDIPDVGSFIALIKAATGRDPDIICGKPHAAMGDGILNLTQKSPEKIAMFGDRLYTDMRFAIGNGFKSVLVLSGETTKTDHQNSKIQVDLVLNSIADFD